MSGGRWWQKASRQNWLPSTAWARTLEESFAVYRTLESILFKLNNFWSDGFDSCLMFTFFEFKIVWKKTSSCVEVAAFFSSGRTLRTVLTLGLLFIFSLLFSLFELKRFWTDFEETAAVWKRQLAQFWPRDFCRSSATAALTLAVARFDCTCTVVLCGACKNTDFSCLCLSDPFFSCWCVFAQKKRKDCQPLSRPMTRGR